MTSVDMHMCLIGRSIVAAVGSRKGQKKLIVVEVGSAVEVKFNCFELEVVSIFSW